ncbi:MAG: HDIG domain-containing protein [Armatimonadetes bacterium]|nr:HDIG domain-containing protein [Armatimonadota bacterium]
MDPKRLRWYLGRGIARAVGATLMGLLIAMHLRWPADMSGIFGAVLVSLVASLLLRYHLQQADLRTTTPRTAEKLVWSAALVGVFGVQAILLLEGGRDLDPQTFLIMAPLAAQAMLTAALIGPGIGIVGLTLTVVLLGMFGAVPTEMLAACWLAGAVGCHAVNHLKRRSDLFKALSVQVGVQALLAAVTAAVVPFSFLQGVLSVGWAGLAAVVGLSIFWFGVAAFERLYGIVSDWTLLELCSPENQLMRDLNLQAPGTYAHSVGVGNLAENAATDIGANAVLCRTMAYYHDVGKLARPSYFAENQAGGNVHDELAPSLSAKVISAHVKDGVEMAKKAGLPKAIIDGIEQHHGTSLITYFYHRALEDGAEGDGLEEQFRYAGPKPQTRETAILHLADMVEAASRSIRGKERLETAIRGLIDATRADGQLDECDLTFRDLQTVADSFVHSLGALRHERVTYPGQEKDEKDAKAHGGDSERVVGAIEG